jgi:hypothetical protein
MERNCGKSGTTEDRSRKWLLWSGEEKRQSTRPRSSLHRRCTGRGRIRYTEQISNRKRDYNGD